MSTRAGGLACYGSVRGNSSRGDRTAITEEPYEAIQRRELPRTGTTRGKVADQTDADPVFVVVVARRLAVGAMLLFVPARTNLNLPVAGADAVSNHEVITEFVPALVAVLAIEQAR